MTADTPLRIAALAAATLLAACATTAKPATAPAPIASSRLGMAKATGTVPAGMVQVEAGYSMAKLAPATPSARRWCASAWIRAPRSASASPRISTRRRPLRPWRASAMRP